jgi:hypothetical protein
MTYIIWKYDIPISDECIIHLMPFDAKILSFQLQNGEPQLWVLVDSTKPMKSRVFRGYGTGHEIENAENLVYIGTVIMLNGKFVYHLFEEIIEKSLNTTLL